jgi:membrane fusion protein, multidrug efflux system
MPIETTERQGDAGDEPGRIELRSASEGVPAEHAPLPASGHPSARRLTLLMGALGALALAAVLAFGIPYIQRTLNTVSTDDAYVNGHVTLVAPRVAGQIARVVVDDNNRVRKGDVIAELDKQPYQIAVSEKQAAVDVANADLQVAMATARSVEARARSARWSLQTAVQEVDNQIALLHARVAALDKQKAALRLAQLDFERAKEVVEKAVSRAEFDRRQAELQTAEDGVTESLAEIHQVRVSLGLPATPPNGDDLGHVPPDLDETFSAVLQAQSELIQSAAQLGVVHSFKQSPKQMLEQFEEQGDIDRTFAQLAAEAPAVKQVEAKLEAANRDLAEAELNLRYCDIRAEIDGVVTRRNVNPGDYVQVGQTLMAIRSLDEIWVDANFKETQLRDMRIGQSVDVYVDMYGDGHVFKGRVAGFTMGTGSTLALLPPENATGNFIKVVQRLPVRIELEGYDPDKTPLFIGTSVVPYVYVNKPATGPDAGKVLQAQIVRQSQTTDTLQHAPGTDQ